MDRRQFLARASAVAAASMTSSMSFAQKAETLEHAMSDELDKAALAKEAVEPWFCHVGDDGQGLSLGVKLMGDDPRLPKMPAAPTLMDFYELRFAPARHVLQSADLALENGYPEKIVMACLLHDIAVGNFIRTDHGYWCAQMMEPYVDEEVCWAIRNHQALRFYPDDSVGYGYPELYDRLFGEDYRPEPYIEAAYRAARNHKWYMTSRLIIVNDLYSFDPDKNVEVEKFTDIMGRNFKHPKEGLGFDGTPVAHMWRSIIWPNNFL